MNELYIGGFVSEASVEDLKRLLESLDGGAAGSNEQEVELLAALRQDPDNMGDYFRLAAGMKIAAHAGK